MTDSQKLDIILGEVQKIGKGVAALEERMDGMEKRMDGMEKRMDSIEQRMDSMEQRMDGMEKRMDSMEQRMDGMEQRMDGMEVRMDRIEGCLENEIRRNITIIAEGHLNLSRKLDEVVQREKFYEYQQVRINVLETDVKKIKDHLHIT